MPSKLTIHGLDPALEEQLRARAARNGRSMEEELHVILLAAVAEGAPEGGLGGAIRGIFADFDDLERPVPAREPPKSR